MTTRDLGAPEGSVRLPSDLIVSGNVVVASRILGALPDVDPAAWSAWTSSRPLTANALLASSVSTPALTVRDSATLEAASANALTASRATVVGVLTAGASTADSTTAGAGAATIASTNDAHAERAVLGAASVDAANVDGRDVGAALASVAAQMPLADPPRDAAWPLKDMYESMAARFGFSTRGAWTPSLPVYAGWTPGAATAAAERAAATLFLQNLTAYRAAGVPGRLEVAPGVYRFANAIYLSGASNLTIAARDPTPGATIFVSEYHKDPNARTVLFELTACSNVCIDGLTHDSNALPYFQGNVVGADLAANTVDFVPFPGFVPEPDYATSYAGKRVIGYDPTGNCATTYTQQSVVSVLPVGGGGTWRATFQKFNDSYIRSALTTPDWVLAFESARCGEGRGGIAYTTILSSGSSPNANITLANLSVWTGVAHNHTSSGASTDSVRHVNCRCLPPAGTVRLLGGGPTQYVGHVNAGGHAFEGCAFDAHYDDGINALAAFGAVANVDDASLNQLCVGFNPAPRVGDRLVVRANVNSAIVLDARITSVTSLNVSSPGADKNAYDAMVAAVRTSTGNSSLGVPTTYRVRVDASVAGVSKYDWAFQEDRVFPWISVSDCYFRNMSAQGVLARARSGVFQRNVVERCWNGFDVGWHHYWLEGPVSRDLVIRDNVVLGSPWKYNYSTSTMWAAITAIGGDRLGSWSSVTRASASDSSASLVTSLANIGILNNTFVDCDGRAVDARGVDGLVVSNNYVLNPGTGSYSVPGTVYVSGCANVVLSNNYVDLGNCAHDTPFLLGANVFVVSQSTNSVAPRAVTLGASTPAGTQRSVAVGTGALGLLAVAGGGRTVGLGFRALGSASSASSCVAVGAGAMGNCATANGGAVALGPYAMSDSGDAAAGGSGGGSVAAGQRALAGGNVSTAVAVGYQALGGVGTATGNGVVALGHGAMQGANVGVSYCTAVGYRAMADARGGVPLSNTALGAFAGCNAQNVMLVAAGAGAMRSTTTGQQSTAVGTNALLATTTSAFNVALGSDALASLQVGAGTNVGAGVGAARTATAAGRVTALGFAALSNSTGSCNVGVGAYAGRGPSSGGSATANFLTAVGAYALANVTTGSCNVGVGYQAGHRISTGGNVTCVGYQAAFSTLANDVTCLGHQAMFSSTTAPGTTAIGSRALFSNVTGTDCTAVGVRALANALGSSSTAVGAYAMQALTTGQGTAVGAYALTSLTTGSQCSAVGAGALGALTTGSSNVAEGAFAGANVTTASSNACLGASALFSNVTGSQCTALGTAALANALTSSNTAVGAGAMQATTTGQGTAVGCLALGSQTTGSQNSAVGTRALGALTVGASNVAEGMRAGGAITTGLSNACVGAFAGANVTTASSNACLGALALYSNVTGSQCTALGTAALANALTSSNTAVGAGAMQATTTGDGTAVGCLALGSQTTGSQNSAVGARALGALTTGASNVAEGIMAGAALTTGLSNVCVGAYAGANLTTASSNVALGTRAMYSGVSVISNVALGAGAMANATDGGNVNVAIGCLALAVNAGSNNVAVGANCMPVNTTGTSNAALGHSALSACTTGSFNTCVGQNAGARITTCGYNVCVGQNAGNGIVISGGCTALGTNALGASDAGNQTVVGWNAMRWGLASGGNSVVGANAGVFLGAGSSNNAVLGANALSNANLSSYNNAIVGFNAAGTANLVNQCVALGADALGGGAPNSADPRLNADVAVGFQAMLAAVTANNCTAVGYQAMSSNVLRANCTAVGYRAMVTNTLYSDCTAVGAFADEFTGDRQVLLGGPNTTPYAYAPLSTRSDLRDKADVRDAELGLEFLEGLRPVQFRWDRRVEYGPGQERDGSKKRKRFHNGLVAQEVAALCEARGVDFAGLQWHAYEGGEDVYTIAYEELIPVLIKGVQELSARVRALEVGAGA